MSPSRPPLTSRIRASFDGKRSKSEVGSPTNPNGFVTSDPDAIRNAIDEAINSETFQIAIAGNLARLIKPSIKDALDTLQPVVEAVYSHEMLLRKMNRSVENILDRVDTNQTRENAPPSPKSPASSHPGTPTTPRQRRPSEYANGQDIDQFKSSIEKSNKRTVATLAELSNAVEENNKKVAEVIDGIGDLHATLTPTKDGLNSLKILSETSNTNTAVMQAQLDQLKADIGFVIDAVGSDLGKNMKGINEQVQTHPSVLASHGTKLDAISTDLVNLKGQADLSSKIQSIVAELDVLKNSVEGGFTQQQEHFGSLGTQVGSVLNAVEGHTGMLSGIKDANTNPAILDAVQKGNESHASHAAILSEIKERSLAPHSISERAPDVSAVDSGSTAAIEALKAEFAILKENIESGLSSSNENLTGLGSKVDNVLVVVEGHKAADQSADILAALEKSNNSHSSHAEALEGIKSLGSATSAPTPEYGTHFSALETQFVALQSTLQSHTSILDEIKAAKPSSSTEMVPTAEATGSSSVETEIASIMNTLESHTSLLSEMKDNIAAEILTSLHDIGEGQANQAALLTEIRDADVSDEILTALHTSNDSHSGHTASLEQLHSAIQASNDSHVASFAELKAPRSIEPSAPTEVGNLEALENQIGTLVLVLAEHKAMLAEIKDATTASNESHVAHASALGDLKSRTAEPVANPTGGNLEALESQISALSAILEEHKATLAAIQDTTVATHKLQGSHTTALSEILDGNTASAGFHTSHTATLAEIKDSTSRLGDLHASHTTALDEIKDAQATHAATMGDSHSQLKEAIGALALGGAAGAGAGAIASHDDGGNSSEILEEVKAVRAIVEKSSTSIDGTEEKVTSIISQIEVNTTTVKSVAASVEDLEGYVKETGSQVGLLSDGVHLNEKGLGQLKEESSLASPRRETMPESTWFGSHSPKTSRWVEAPQMSPEEKQYNYLSPVAEEHTPTQEEAPIPAAPKEDESAAEPSAPVEDSTVSVEEPATEESKPHEEEDAPATEVPSHEAEHPAAAEESIEPEEVLPAPETHEPENEAIAESERIVEPTKEENALVAEEPVSKVAENVAEKHVESEPVAEAQEVEPEDSHPAPEHTAEEPNFIPEAEVPEPQEEHEPSPEVEHDESHQEPLAHASEPGREEEPEWPSTPSGETGAESASASTSAIASPQSPSFPLSPGSKKGKKGKKKNAKGKKEKVPFEMEGEDPEE